MKKGTTRAVKEEAMADEEQEQQQQQQQAQKPDEVLSCAPGGGNDSGQGADPVVAMAASASASAATIGTTSAQQQQADVLQDPSLISSLLANMSEEAIMGLDTNNNNNGTPAGGNNHGEDDEIVREIDVYLSPKLIAQMSLVQFPNQPSSLATSKQQQQLMGNQKQKHGNKNSNHKLPRNPPPAVPEAARIKPNNSILELDYKVHTNSFSSQHSIPEVLNLPQRTYKSQTVPMKTHMALGLFDKTGTKIDLVPLSNDIYQMRPTFSHVDALFDNEEEEDEIEQQRKKEEAKKKKNDGDKPIMFQKPESERTMMQRLNSYAYKKITEEGEEWVDLDVYGPGTEERKEMVKECYCPKEKRNIDLKFVHGNVGAGADADADADDSNTSEGDEITAISAQNTKTNREANYGYVRSLNYLPNQIMMGEEGDGVGGRQAAQDEEDFKPYTGKEEDKGQDEKDDESDAIPSWKRELTERVAKLLQGRGGVPIPYPVIRSRYHPSISDEALMEALSASAAVVRGNFLVKSSLLGLTNPHIVTARDFILVLFNKYGFVQREKLSKVYNHDVSPSLTNDNNDEGNDIEMKDTKEDDKDEAKKAIIPEVLDTLLNMVGRKTVNGFEMKVDDNPNFQVQFPEVAKLHAEYWQNKEIMLSTFVEEYEEQMENQDII